jgi:hypothetical protein
MKVYLQNVIGSSASLRVEIVGVCGLLKKWPTGKNESE